MREAQNNFFLPPLGAPRGGQNCKFKTFGFFGIRQKYNIRLHYTVQLPCKYYFISPSNKTSRKKHVSKKSTFYYIFMLVFKLEIVKDIFENEKK